MIVVATVGMFAAMTLALGLLLAFTPYLMRRNECFAVTVPASAQKDHAWSLSRSVMQRPWSR